MKEVFEAVSVVDERWRLQGRGGSGHQRGGVQTTQHPHVTAVWCLNRPNRCRNAKDRLVSPRKEILKLGANDGVYRPVEAPDTNEEVCKQLRTLKLLKFGV